jgi:hypothetical protein
LLRIVFPMDAVVKIIYEKGQGDPYNESYQKQDD